RRARRPHPCGRARRRRPRSRLHRHAQPSRLRRAGHRGPESRPRHRLSQLVAARRGLYRRENLTAGGTVPPTVSTTPQALTVVPHAGDAKPPLAFDLAESAIANLAGFTVECRPQGQPSYYLSNTLQFQDPTRHAQVTGEKATSSVNAPFHKFRWLHVPGSLHQ